MSQICKYRSECPMFNCVPMGQIYCSRAIYYGLLITLMSMRSQLAKEPKYFSLHQKWPLTTDSSTLHQALNTSCLVMRFHLAEPLMECTSKEAPFSCSYHAAVSLIHPGLHPCLSTGIIKALLSLPYKAFPRREASIICLKQ